MSFADDIVFYFENTKETAEKCQNQTRVHLCYQTPNKTFTNQSLRKQQQIAVRKIKRIQPKW